MARVIPEFLPEIEFMGKVKMVSPVVDPESGTVKATIEMEDFTGGVLRPGMFVSVFYDCGTTPECFDNTKEGTDPGSSIR